MSINEIISIYLAAKAAESAANKAAREAKARAEAAAADILAHAAGKPAFETELFTVSIGKETRVILDQQKLFKDFPGIKNLDQYGRESTRDTITALARCQAESISA